jgi:E3 ubiquitin-protein ligase RNF181
MDDDDDWITARYLLSSILGRNPLVVDHVDEESFPVVEPPPPSVEPSRAILLAPQPPAVRAPAGVAGTVCAVCTEEIKAAEAVARLPCAHWYHHGCIAPWLGIRNTCPICRAELPPRAGEGDEEGRVKPRGASSAAGASAGARRDAASSYHQLLAGGMLSG